MSVADLLHARSQCLLLGAKGAGMTALADILLGGGHDVSGMDQNVFPGDSLLLTNSERFPIAPWSMDGLNTDDIDLCIASSAIPKESQLLQRIRAADIPVISLHECLALIFASRQQICVAGTHGKSTTTAMLAWILEQDQRKPGFFVGAEQANFGCSGRYANNELAVLESCEFLHSFRHLQPQVTVLTGIERDHFDCYPDQQSEDAAFRNFVNQTATNGAVILRSECPRSMAVTSEIGCRRVTCAVNDDARTAAGTADWVASDFTQAGTESTFRCTNGAQSRQVRLRIPGRHNVRNALVAIAGASSVGVSLDVCCRALESFAGIRRRFEIRGQYHGITLIDDYAHHPTAIHETLRTVRQVFPGSRLLAAFEPHQLVRTNALFAEFVHALSAADEVLLLPVFPARETATHLECCRTSGQLVKELNRRGSKAFLFANLDQIVSRIDHSGRPSDIFLTMGAGRTNLIHDELTRRIQRHSVA